MVKVSCQDLLWEVSWVSNNPSSFHGSSADKILVADRPHLEAVDKPLLVVVDRRLVADTRLVGDKLLVEDLVAVLVVADKRLVVGKVLGSLSLSLSWEAWVAVACCTPSIGQSPLGSSPSAQPLWGAACRMDQLPSQVSVVEEAEGRLENWS